MRYIIKPHRGIFVAITDAFVNGTSIDEVVDKLRRRTRAVQTWFFDLDDNHADSPAKNIARKAMGTSHFSPHYLGWCAQTAWKLAREGKAAESEVWKEYVNRFLRNEKALAKIKSIWTPESARQSLYPGVEDFVQLISSAKRLYVTRNISEVAEAYTRALGLDGFFPETDHKEKIVENYVQRNPGVERFGVDGDSEEDAAMIDVLKFYRKEVLGLYSMDKPNGRVHPAFDVSVSKDRTGLVRLIGEEITNDSD